DEATDRRADLPEQSRNQEEDPESGDCAGEKKDRKPEAGGPGENGDKLERKWRDAGDKHGPGAVFVVFRREYIEPACISVKIQNRAPDAFEGERAESVSENAA